MVPLIGLLEVAGAAEVVEVGALATLTDTSVDAPSSTSDTVIERAEASWSASIAVATLPPLETPAALGFELTYLA